MVLVQQWDGGSLEDVLNRCQKETVHKYFTVLEECSKEMISVISLAKFSIVMACLGVKHSQAVVSFHCPRHAYYCSLLVIYAKSTLGLIPTGL